MNTTENNKLIAEFIGFEKSIVGNGQGKKYDYNLPDWVEMITENDLHYCSDCGNSLHSADHVFASELLFHTSWDWLMPVIEYIDQILPDDNFVTITYNNCLIEWFEKGITFEGIGNTRLEATYKAVLNFIDWFNENRQQILCP